MNRDEQTYINELNNLLSQYHISNSILEGVLGLFALFVAFAVALIVGMFWLTIIVLVVGFLIILLSKNMGLRIERNTLPLGKLAYEVCVVMEILIRIKNGEKPIGDAFVLTVGTGRHINLYNQFIALYPQLKSTKLKKLAKVEIQLHDMYD